MDERDRISDVLRFGVPVLGLGRRWRAGMHGHPAVVRAVDQPILGVVTMIHRPTGRRLRRLLHLHSHSLQIMDRS
jgi:hypothetical protein